MTGDKQAGLHLVNGTKTADTPGTQQTKPISDP